MDRIDLVVPVRALEPGVLAEGGNGERSGLVRKKVLASRAIQAARGSEDMTFTNAARSPDQLRIVCPLEEAHRKIMDGAVRNLGLTARGYHRILRVARTIADLEGVEYPTAEHLAEALQYRPILESHVSSFRS